VERALRTFLLGGPLEKITQLDLANLADISNYRCLSVGTGSDNSMPGADFDQKQGYTAGNAVPKADEPRLYLG
jgi:hypothetical protein